MRHAAAWTCAVLVTCGSIAPPTFAATVDFNALTPDTPAATFGDDPDGTPDDPGDVVHVEDMISMSVEEFFFQQFVGYNVATVGGRFTDRVSTTNPLDLNNISVRFDFTGLAFPVTTVTLDYWYFGGANNFAVNVDEVTADTVLVVDWLTELPTDVADGVTATVENNAITLQTDGIIPITSFVIGGQELNVDNIVAVPEPASAVWLALGALALIGRRPRRARKR